jgi:hypothetical protein
VPGSIYAPVLFAMFWTFHAGGAEELMFVNDAISTDKADQQDSDDLYRIVTRRQIWAIVFGGLGTLIFLASIGSFILFALLNLFAPTPQP